MTVLAGADLVQFKGWVAQLAEQWTENPRVGGSIPPPAIPPFSEVKYQGKRDFFCSHPMWPEMKENEGLGGLRRHAVSCNFSGQARARAPAPPEIVLIARTTRK